MRAGSLRHRITIEAQAEVQDAAGDVTLDWTAFASNVPAEFKPGPGREYLAGEAIRNEVTGRFMLRYMPGVLPSMRVQWDGEAWRIAAVLPDPTARKELTLMVERDGTD